MKYCWIFIPLLLVSCKKIADEKLEYSSTKTDSKILGGVIMPYAFTALYNKEKSFFPLAYASACSDVTVNLVQLDTNGKPQYPAISKQQMQSNGRYQFDATKLGLSNGDNIRYLVEATGCNANYSRLVTSIDKKQHLDDATTLMSFTTFADLGKSLTDANRIQVEALIKNLRNKGDGIASLYTELKNNPELKNQFQTLFQALPSALDISAPKLGKEDVTLEIGEETTTTYEVQAVHFNTTYIAAYEWQLNGTTVSTSHSYDLTTNKNSQGTHSLTLKMGHSNSGTIDTSKPVFIKNYSIVVEDDYSATPPGMSIGDPNVPSITFDVDINTGAAMVNCETFSSLALTDGNATPVFDITCNTAGTQIESYTLKDTSEGNKTIKLWAKDAAGNISQVPSTLSVVFDSLPVVAITTPSPALLSGGTTYTLTLSGTDGDGSALDSLTLYYASDGTTYSTSYTLSTAAISSFDWTVPSDDTTTAKLKISGEDNIGNIIEVETSAFEIDSTAPSATSFAFTQASYNTTTIGIDISDCTDRPQIFISESATVPALGHSDWQACQTSTSYSYTLTNTADGTKTVYVYARDAAGNISSASDTFLLDQTAPVISWTTIPTYQKGGTSFDVYWELTEVNAAATQNFILEYHDGSAWQSLGTSAVSDGPHTGQTFTETVSFNSDDTSVAKLRISYTDLVGNAVSVESGTFTIDSTAPVLSSLEFINGDNRTFDNNLLLTDLQATDNISGISEICFNDDTVTPPAAGDTCWEDLTAAPFSLSPSTSISLNSTYNFKYAMSIGLDSFDVRGWLKDRAGNISATTSTVGTDMQKVFFSSRYAPTITSIIVKASDAPSSIQNDNTLNNTNPMYIKWVAGDQQVQLDGNNEPIFSGDDPVLETVSLPANSIKIYYKTDSIAWTELDSGATYSNGSNGACGFDSGIFSGCALVTSKTNDPFELKLEVTNSAALTAAANSTFLNTGAFRHIAGNLNDGQGADATKAVFFHMISGGHATHGMLAVDSSGITYFNDYKRGIFKIDPAVGEAQLYIKTKATGGHLGLGGPASSAQLYNQRHMTIDTQDRLVIWAHNMILRVEADGTINKILGGGATPYPTTPIDPMDLQVQTATNQLDYHSLAVLPNGDIAFGKYTHKGFWKFDVSTNKVQWYEFSGTGDSAGAANSAAAADINPWYTRGFLANETTGELDSVLVSSRSNIDSHTAGIRYNALGVSEGPHPAYKTAYTSYTLGKDNNIYVIDRYATRIQKYNKTTRVFDNIAGNGTPGDCDDNVLATSCAMEPRSIYVTAAGRIYFYNRGRIRFIDNDNKVQTLYGQPLWYGDGGPATSARLGDIWSIDTWHDSGSGKDYVIVRDESEKVYREFEINGTINTIAGTRNRLEAGYVTALNNNAVGAHYSPFITNKNNGNIYAHQSSQYMVLNRSNGMWERVAGGGTNNYYSADGTSSVKFLTGSRYGQNPIALNTITGSLLGHAHYYNGSSYGSSMLKEWNLTTGIQTHRVGTTTHPTVTAWPAGTYTASTAEAIQNNGSIYRLYGQFDDSFGTQGRYIFIRGVSTKLKQLDIANDELSDLGTLPQNTKGGIAYVKATNKLYYCGYNDGRVYEYNISTTVTTAMDWPMTDVICAGYTITYSPARNSILFPIQKDSLFGVAEIFL
jgi:hypothetical protein